MEYGPVRQCLNILVQDEKSSRIEPGFCGLCRDMVEAKENRGAFNFVVGQRKVEVMMESMNRVKVVRTYSKVLWVRSGT